MMDRWTAQSTDRETDGCTHDNTPWPRGNNENTKIIIMFHRKAWQLLSFENTILTFMID